MSAPVKKLTFSDPRGKGDVSIDLDWDLLHPEGQKEFDRLDADDSGDLSFSKEIKFSNATAENFFRTFWAFGGDAPNNNFKSDQATRATRRAEVVRIQGDVFDKVIRPLVKGQKDLSLWREAGRLLVTMADPAHLCDLADLAKAQSSDLAFLQASESFLLEAKRLAAGTRWGRTEHYSKIEKFLQKVGGEVEKAEADQFKKDLAEPHFLLGAGAPATADFRKMLTGGTITLRVTVPKGFDKDKLVETLNGFHPRLNPSTFEGAHSGSESYALEAKALVSDSHAVIRKNRLSSLYYGQNRDYYEVSFSVKENGETMQAMMVGRGVRRFDLAFDLPEAKERSVSGGIVLQDKQGKDIHMVFASDLHVNERDNEIRKIMLDSLATMPMGGREAPDTAAMERVERFYESFNEHLEAAVAQWNQEYREGKLDYVVLAGDLADFINIPTTSAPQLFRGTNFRRLAHILSKLEAPYYSKPGNHDVHLRPYPVSVHKQHFSDDPWLYQFLQGHYDDYRFTGPDPMLVQGVMALMPRSWPEPQKGDEAGHLDFYALALGELLSDNPYGKVNDEGLPPYWRSTESNEADVTPLGNKLYLYNWKTNEEDFNQQRWAFEQVNEPVGLNLIKSFQTYVFSEHVNGKGPRPEVFRHFLNTVDSVKAEGGTMVVAQHYPAFYLGVGPDQTADSEDSLRGPVNWAFRLATWYYRHADGRPVVDLVVAGHVHRYGEYDFQLQFDSPEEEKSFRKDLGALLTNVAGGKVKDADVYDRFDDLRKKYVLDQHLVTERYLDSKNGFPGPVAQGYNQGWKGACTQKGSLFVNLPALGPTTADSPSGFLRVTVSPNGQKKVSMDYLYLEPDGRVLRESGDRLPALKKTHRQLIGDWFTSHGDVPAIPKDEDGFNPPAQLSAEEQRARAFAGPPLLDPLPLLCQYPKGKICLGAGIGATYQFTNQGAGPAFSATPLSLTFPLSDRHHPIFGLNYLRTSLNYNSGFKQWSGDFSLGLGIFEPHLFSGFRVNDPNNIVGGGIKFGSASSMVIPAVDLFGFSSIDRNQYGLGLGATWQWELLSLKPHRHQHSH